MPDTSARIVAVRVGVLAILGLISLANLPPSAIAQFERHELGRRLREFEVDWDRAVDPAARSRASRALIAAEVAASAPDPAEAARSIAEARFALRGGVPTAAERWAESLACRPEARLVDATSAELRVAIAPFYPAGPTRPGAPTIRLSLGGSAESRVEAPLGALPMTLAVPIRGLSAGDHALVAEVRSGGALLARSSRSISIVEQLDDRISSLRKVIGTWPVDDASTTVDRESARGRLRTLESLAARMTLDFDLPAGRMLDELEVLTLAADRSEPYLGKDRAGQDWATVVIGSGRRVPTRVFVPEAAAKGDPLPIVVALHGAGGTENSFFEGYGHGAIVDRCRERGWFLVAPRSTAFGGPQVAEVVDELGEIYPVDRERVMLVGYSWGAGRAVDAASGDPTRLSAVAALGGGGSIVSRPGLKALPFFVGVGSEDPALPTAKNLAGYLKLADVAVVEFREYPAIGQLTIVQVALPDVFRFFDERSKAK